MKLTDTLGTLDWGDWVLGLWSAVITGGSSAVVAAMGLIVLDPKDFSVGQSKLWITALNLFLWTGFLGMLNFLRAKPAPGFVQTVTATKTTSTDTSTSPPAKIVQTVTETKVEPLPPTPTIPTAPKGDN